VAINNETKAEHKLSTGDVLHIGPCSLRYEEAHTPTTRNFSDLFVHFNFGRYLLNSFFLTSAGTSISLILSSLGGFALAKYNFKGKHALLILMLATMMIPGSVLLAPSYELICKMGMMNSYLGILLPGAVGAFGMLLFRQAMLGIPDDLLEAARIDGCSEVRIYWNIVMPVVRPMSGAFCLMSFMGGWNSFLWPMIVLQSENLFTVPIALSQTIGLQGDNLYGLLMAGTFLGVLPPAVLFFMLQKEFIAGLTAGAVKG
jgi:ABC-type glycerol-3-phosphate transport system permease component